MYWKPESEQMKGMCGQIHAERAPSKKCSKTLEEATNDFYISTNQNLKAEYIVYFYQNYLVSKEGSSSSKDSPLGE